MIAEQIYSSCQYDSRDVDRPLFLSTVKAGFPSPADDFMEQRLNINDYVVKRPSSTYYVRVSGDSMIGAGIYSGDILVVDRSITITDNCIVVAMIDNEFMVKRFCKHKGHYYLLSENSQYDPIEVTDTDLFVWGVVTYTIHKPS